MIYLPLDKIISQQEAVSGVKGGGAPAVTGQLMPTPEQMPAADSRLNKDGRTRDSRDIRDREVR
jgi:hypothetical protein